MASDFLEKAAAVSPADEDEARYEREYQRIDSGLDEIEDAMGDDDEALELAEEEREEFTEFIEETDNNEPREERVVELQEHDPENDDVDHKDRWNKFAQQKGYHERVVAERKEQTGHGVVVPNPEEVVMIEESRLRANRKKEIEKERKVTQATIVDKAGNELKTHVPKRVHELSKEIKVPSKEIIAILGLKSHLTKVTLEQEKALTAALAKQKTKKKEKKPIKMKNRDKQVQAELSKSRKEMFEADPSRIDWVPTDVVDNVGMHPAMWRAYLLWFRDMRKMKPGLTYEEAKGSLSRMGHPMRYRARMAQRQQARI